MEEKALNKPTMVSRLPKFGARPQGGTSPLSNGTGQPLHSQEGRGGAATGKANGTVRLTSPFSLKWKKSGGSPSPSLWSPAEGAEPPRQGEEGRAGHRPQPLQQPPAPRELKKPSAPSAKLRRSASSVTPTTHRTTPQPSKLAPRGAFAQPKPGLISAAGRFGLGLQRTGSIPGVGRGRGGGLQDGLSQSSDSLKALSPDSMVRSQSFTHFKQVPSPTGPPITRSFSFTRATEVAKPPPGAPQRAKTLLARPAAHHGKGPAARPGGGPVPPSNLRKPLQPVGAPSKAPTLPYRLTRPSLVKQQPRPALAGKARAEQEAESGSRDSLATPPVTPDPPSETENAPAPESRPPETREPEPSTRYLGEALEDMSLSSTSSLERNDTSEEYLDDFDNLGDGGSLLLFPDHDDGALELEPRADDNSPAGGPHGTRLCSFLTDSVDWAAMGLTGVKDDLGVPCCLGDQAESPEVDFPHGSSLDLSPSDSSGGTYMWDEEGLEPLGTTTHPCGSYDSDLNSLDILNNLDNLESCDLEDDDLMLDVDLTEDCSLHSDADGMSHFERAERGGRQGHWRRRQHRWSGSDHFHNDNRGGGGFQQFDGHLGEGVARVGARQLQVAVRNDGHMAALDDLTLSHMTDDCSSVKSQLLKLKILLQVEDGGTIQDALESGILSPEPREDPSMVQQVEELLREVEELREELRSKERTIAQMTQQVSELSEHATSCQCQQRRPESRGEMQTCHDKAAQTPWRAHSPPVLQPSSPWPSERLPQERLARTAPTADPNEVAMAARDDRQHRDLPCLDSYPDAAGASALGPDRLSLLLNSRLRLGDYPVSTATRATAAGASESPFRPVAQPLPAGEPRKPLPPAATVPVEKDLGDRRPRFLQSLRLHKKVSVPTLSPEGPARPAAGERPANPMPASAALPKKKQLPPPTRGLPCFSSGPQSSGLPRAPTLFGPFRPLGPRDPENGLPKAGGLVPPNYSRLPKPKIH